MENSRFILFCVYHNPADFPGQYVARRWVGLDPDYAPAAVAPTLEEVREKLLKDNPGLTRLDRQENDDPVIVETWL